MKKEEKGYLQIYEGAKQRSVIVEEADEREVEVLKVVKKRRGRRRRVKLHIRVKPQTNTGGSAATERAEPAPKGPAKEPVGLLQNSYTAKGTTSFCF